MNLFLMKPLVKAEENICFEERQYKDFYVKKSLINIHQKVFTKYRKKKELLRLTLHKTEKCNSSE